MNAYGQAPSAGWAESLRSSDAGRVWSRLHRLVRNHPLTSHSSSANVTSCATHDSHDDLTQELFVTLLGKDRFRHYLDAGMSDREIESEIAQIELTNLLTTGLRKRYPESYRLARRISVILRTSRRFRRFDAARGRGGRHVRLTGQVYGLSHWPDGAASRPHPELERRVAAVPVRRRDLRMKGCTGDSQLVIGNAALEGLVAEVLEAMGAPADVRTIRGLVMSRLPVLDVHLTQFGALGDEADRGKVFDPADARPTPEQEALRRESDGRAGERVDEFLSRLGEEAKGKPKQYERLLSVLWLCYLSPAHITQLEAAARLNVSDSLVSDYRRRIERALCALSLASLEEARLFEEALRDRMKAREEAPAAPEKTSVSPPPFTSRRGRRGSRLP
ncbi:MAG TPA: hypothetical protein VF659_13045 [Pyrinomonadaceae bacterium]